MKIGFKIVFWVLSLALVLLSLVLFFGGVLPGVLMLSAAIIINPLFLEGIQLKKGVTALLVIGLFIAAIAVLPAATETGGDMEPAAALADTNVIRSSNVSKEANQLQKETILQANSIERSVETEVTPTPTSEPTPNLTPTSTPTAAPTSTPTPKPTATPTTKPTVKPTIKPTVTPTVKPTVTPTVKPTAVPTPTKTPKATASPAPTEAITRAKATGIAILDYSESVGRGERAFIEIQGAPNTDYTCDVEYKSGYSTADGLGTKQSNAKGVVRWTWKVGSRTSLDYTPTIYISGGGDSTSVDFEVTK